jgi:uncharacterized protein (TIGR02145 family)
MISESKSYKTVEIGDQIWMAENLNSQIENSKCYNSDEFYCNIYGRLYIMEEAYNACPSGWRLPKKEEWEKLLDFAGNMETAVEKLKATNNWDGGNGENTYGFAALPGGYQAPNTGYCTSMGTLGIWWSSTASESNSFYSLSISAEKGIQFNSQSVLYRLSIRCIKDNN